MSDRSLTTPIAQIRGVLEQLRADVSALQRRPTSQPYTAKQLAAIVSTPLVTILPAPAYDGQEVILALLGVGTNPLLGTNVDVVARCRYRAASTRPYKWDVIGGGRVVLQSSIGFGTASAVYVGITGFTSAALPTNIANCEVRVSVGTDVFITTANISGVYVGYSVGATAATDNLAAQYFNNVAATMGVAVTVKSNDAYYNAPGGATIVPAMRGTGGTWNVGALSTITYQLETVG